MAYILMYACAPQLASAFAAQLLTTRAAPQSKPPNPIRMALNFSPDKMRDIKTIDNAMYIMYDMIYKDSLPEFLTQENITNYLTSCGTEFNETTLLYKINKQDVTNAIDAVVKEATRMKDVLIAEEKGAESAEIIAGAAQIAAAVLSWCPGVNVGLDAVALAAYVTATGLEIDTASYENTVIDYINKMNSEVVKQPGMEIIEKWQTAVSFNGVFYPKLDLGVTESVQRAMMLSIPTGISRYHLGHADAAGYKAYIKQIGGFVFDNQDIVATYERLLASIDSSTTQAEFDEAKAKLGEGIPAIYKIAMDGLLDIVTLSLAIKGGRAALNARALFANGADLAEINGEGLVAEDGAVEAAEGWIRANGGIGRAVGFIGGALVIIMAGFEISETIKLDHELTKTIDETHTSLTKYYDAILTSVPPVTELD